MDGKYETRNFFGSAILVFAAALLVRILFLNRTALWGDETLFIKYLADVSLSPWQIFLDYWDACTDVGQLPLGGIILNVYLHLVGRFIPDASTSVLILRIPGALAGALAAVGVFALGRRWASRPVAWAATAMAVFFFFPVYYSREVYCYPYVLLFGVFASHYFLKGLFDERVGFPTVLAFFLWAAGLGLSHYGCSVLLAAMGILTAGRWAWYSRWRHRPDLARRAAWMAAACVLAGLTVAPYWVRILITDNSYIAAESTLSVFHIVNDVVSKLFLGDRLVPSALAWLLLATGLVSMGRRTSDAGAARTAASLLVLSAIILTILTKKSQYASVRYFAMLSPLAYLVFAEGLWTVSLTLSRLIRRPDAATAMFSALTAGGVAVHIGLFLPAMYRLTEKGVPYATTARWLNENAVPGSPYFFDCGAYDLRYFPRFYATPGLVPTVEIAGNSPGFIDDVRDIQRQIMARFPISYYIRNPAIPWDEADRFYRNVMEYRNPSMAQLRRYGIAPFTDIGNANDDVREILYNTRDDAIAMAQEAGLPIFVDYPGFRCAPVMPGVYGHVVNGRYAELDILNLHEAPLQGVFKITGALSSESPQASATLTLSSGDTVATVLPCEKIWIWKTMALSLPAGTTRLSLTVNDPAVEKWLIMDVQFIEH